MLFTASDSSIIVRGGGACILFVRRKTDPNNCTPTPGLLALWEEWILPHGDVHDHRPIISIIPEPCSVLLHSLHEPSLAILANDGGVIGRGEWGRGSSMASPTFSCSLASLLLAHSEGGGWCCTRGYVSLWAATGIGLGRSKCRPLINEEGEEGPNSAAGCSRPVNRHIAIFWLLLLQEKRELRG